MKIDYNYEDAQSLINSLIWGKQDHAKRCKTKTEAWEEGFLQALTCCGVERVGLRILAPNGKEFPKAQIEAFNRKHGLKG